MGSSSGGGGSSGSSKSSSISKAIGNAIGGPIGGAVASGLSSVYNSINSKAPTTTQAVGTTPAVGTTSGVYRTNDPGAQQKIDRLGQLYTQAMTTGDTASANSYHLLANQIREAQGLRPGIDFNIETGETYGTPRKEITTPETEIYTPWQPIDNTALYNQQAAAKQAQLRQALQRQRTTAEGNISGIESQYGTAIQTAQNLGAQLPAQFTQLNNQASNRGQVNAQRIRTAMAQMGLGQSGESASQQLQQGIDTSNQINANNQQLQTLTSDINTQVTGLQGEQAAKVAAIRQAIADAEASGDENAALALSEAQAKIASDASLNAQKANERNFEIAKLKQAAIDKASTDAWDRSGFESSYALEKAKQAIRDANTLEAQSWYFPLAKQQAEANVANTQRSANAPYGGSSGGGGPSQTIIDRSSFASAVADVTKSLNTLQGSYGSQAYANKYSTEYGLLAPAQVVEQQINAQRAQLRAQGIDPDKLIDEAYLSAYGVDRDTYWQQANKSLEPDYSGLRR